MLLHTMSENVKKRFDRGIVHLTKIVFLSERELKQNDFIGYDYEFFRWTHGPMTAGIYQDFNFFEQCGILAERGKRESIPKLTHHGRSFVESCAQLFVENITIINNINTIIAEYGEWNTHRIKEFCYKIPVHYRGKQVPIREIPKGEIIHMPKGGPVEKKGFSISDEWTETLLLLMDADFVRDYNQSLVEVRNDGSTPIFGG